MSKSIKLYASSIGGYIASMSLYHTSIAPANIIAENITPAQLTGSGVTVQVADGVDTFWALVSDSGDCTQVSASFSNSVFQPNKRYFNVANSGSLTNTVQINAPITAGPTTSSLEQTVNFVNHSAFIIEASYVYPDYTAFLGWYDSETGGNLISTANPLTITQTTFTGSDSFWARFEGFTRTFELSSSRATVNEGDNLTITLLTTSVDGGSTFDYTITGISQSDLSAGNITGTFTVDNQSGSIALTIAEDAVSEGVETLTIDLDDVVCDPISVTINDTSTTPAPTYTLSANTPVDEGDTVVFTLTTTNVAAGTILPFTITGISSDDINENLTGNFTVNNNTAQTIVSLVNDNTTEGTETMTLSLNNGGASQSVTINDTSILVGTVLINSGSYSVSTNNITGDFTGTLSLNYTVGVTDLVLGTPRAWVSGVVKCGANSLHNPLFYGIDPIELEFTDIGTVSPGTYTYTSTVNFTGYTGTCRQHSEAPITGSGAQQEAYSQVVTLGSGPASWNHIGTNFTNTTEALTLIP